MGKYPLKSVDTEDMDDAIKEVANSFGIEFRHEDNLPGIKTFGEFCGLVHLKMEGTNTNDCTTRQAFYKLRKVIGGLLTNNSAIITPQSRLTELIPRAGRRGLIRRLKMDLGISVSFLEPPTWISTTLLLGVLASIVELFFNWRYGLVGLGSSIWGFKIADHFGKEFAVLTVGEAAKKMARINYAKSRRDQRTLNFGEVDVLIRDCFCDKLALDPAVLTADAQF